MDALRASEHRHMDLIRVDALRASEHRHTDFQGVDALRASEHRHTDFTDLNGCHGLIRTLILELAAGFWHLATGSRHSLLC